MIIPIETCATSEGTLLAAHVVGTSHEAIEQASADFAEHIGGIVLDDQDSRVRDGKATFFSSSHWNARWQPTGPTPPWAQKPENN